MISHDKFSSDYVWIIILLLDCCLAMLAHLWENRTFAIYWRKMTVKMPMKFSHGWVLSFWFWLDTLQYKLNYTAPQTSWGSCNIDVSVTVVMETGNFCPWFICICDIVSNPVLVGRLGKYINRTKPPTSLNNHFTTSSFITETITFN